MDGIASSLCFWGGRGGFLCLFVCFRLFYTAHEILIPQPVIESVPLHWKGAFHWTAREVLGIASRLYHIAAKLGHSHKNGDR